jgi:hypothetical protein
MFAALKYIHFNVGAVSLPTIARKDYTQYNKNSLICSKCMSNLSTIIGRSRNIQIIGHLRATARNDSSHKKILHTNNNIGKPELFIQEN